MRIAKVFHSGTLTPLAEPRIEASSAEDSMNLKFRFPQSGEERSSLIAEARSRLHQRIFSENAGSLVALSEARSQITAGITRKLFHILGVAENSGATSNEVNSRNFEPCIVEFLKTTFLQLDHLRPGNWSIQRGRDRLGGRILNCLNYDHIIRLSEKAKSDPDLRAALGGDYLIEPDVVVVRDAESEEFLNGNLLVVDDTVAKLAPLRAINNDGLTPSRLLHASISCKWTLRSDRSQNARTEALNLIRNRNGRVPHIVAITAEPTPKRIASIAQGTSDLDCVYHVALPELREAVAESLEGRRSEQGEDLDFLIAAKRLRDISDLPLDLSI
jgi:hypothetical protein